MRRANVALFSLERAIRVAEAAMALRRKSKRGRTQRAAGAPAPTLTAPVDVPAAAAAVAAVSSPAAAVPLMSAASTAHLLHLAAEGRETLGHAASPAILSARSAAPTARSAATPPLRSGAGPEGGALPASSAAFLQSHAQRERAAVTRASRGGGGGGPSAPQVAASLQPPADLASSASTAAAAAYTDVVFVAEAGVSGTEDNVYSGADFERDRGAPAILSPSVVSPRDSSARKQQSPPLGSARRSAYAGGGDAAGALPGSPDSPEGHWGSLAQQQAQAPLLSASWTELQQHSRRDPPAAAHQHPQYHQSEEEEEEAQPPPQRTSPRDAWVESVSPREGEQQQQQQLRSLDAVSRRRERRRDAGRVSDAHGEVPTSLPSYGSLVQPTSARRQHLQQQGGAQASALQLPAYVDPSAAVQLPHLRQYAGAAPPLDAAAAAVSPSGRASLSRRARASSAAGSAVFSPPNPGGSPFAAMQLDLQAMRGGAAPPSRASPGSAHRRSGAALFAQMAHNDAAFRFDALDGAPVLAMHGAALSASSSSRVSPRAGGVLGGGSSGRSTASPRGALSGRSAASEAVAVGWGRSPRR